MKNSIILANLPQGIRQVSKLPARRALDAGLVTETDLLRLKAIARLHARGLPSVISWSDLLQEAFTRVLEGSRQQPAGVPMVAFLAGVMRSIKEQYWRQYRKGAGQQPKSLAHLGDIKLQEKELTDPAPGVERQLIAVEAMAAINELFKDDLPARQIIAALYEGLTAEETCSTYAMSTTDYDSTRKRIRRALIRAGLRFEPL